MLLLNVVGVAALTYKCWCSSLSPAVVQRLHPLSHMSIIAWESSQIKIF